MDTDEGDSEKHKEQRNSTNVFEGHFINVINVFSSFWLRYIVPNNNEVDRFLLNYRSNFLPYFGGVLYFIYFITEFIK